MNIISVANNLYRVTDVFPQEIIDFCKTANWNSFDYVLHKKEKEDYFPRKEIKYYQYDILKKLKQQSFLISKELEVKLNWKFTDINKTNLSLWYDPPGFTSLIHRDFDPFKIVGNNFSLPITMQVYLTDSKNDLGTKFYYDEYKTKIKYEFPYEINTGYLMVNDWDQWHEMLGPIMPDDTRISCHFIFSNLVTTKN